MELFEVCQGCKLNRQQFDVKKEMFKPGLKINTKRMGRTYRQDKIDEFIILLDCSNLKTDFSM